MPAKCIVVIIIIIIIIMHRLKISATFGYSKSLDNTQLSRLVLVLCVHSADEISITTHQLD